VSVSYSHLPQKSQIQAGKSGSITTIISEETITFDSGRVGKRLELDSTGRSNSVFAEINGYVVALVCYGDLEDFDEIAKTLSLVN